MLEVGRLYGISRERVRQLFYWNGLPRRRHGWYPPGHPKRDAYLLRLSNSAAMSATPTPMPLASRTIASQLGLRAPRSMSER